MLLRQTLEGNGQERSIDCLELGGELKKPLSLYV